MAILRYAIVIIVCTTISSSEGRKNDMFDFKFNIHEEPDVFIYNVPSDGKKMSVKTGYAENVYMVINDKDSRGNNRESSGNKKFADDITITKTRGGPGRTFAGFKHNVRNIMNRGENMWTHFNHHNLNYRGRMGNRHRNKKAHQRNRYNIMNHFENHNLKWWRDGGKDKSTRNPEYQEDFSPDPPPEDLENNQGEAVQLLHKFLDNEVYGQIINGLKKYNTIKQ